MEFYDTSQLLLRIKQQYGDIHKFCDAANFEPVQFLERLAENKLTMAEIQTASKVLDITPDEINFYFFNPVTPPRTPGRPRKENLKTTTPPKNGHYYTISEASNLLNVHRHTLQERLRTGTLKGKLIGRTWRIYRDELFDNSSYLYYFDCTDGYFGEKYLTPNQIDEMENHKKDGHGDTLPEGSIIAIAQNIEATLYRCNSDKSNEVCIYDCMDL